MTDILHPYEWKNAYLAVEAYLEASQDEESLFDSLPEEDYTEEEIAEWESLP